MGSAISSSMSSPEPDDPTHSTADRLLAILNQKPLRLASMLRLTRIINDSSSEEKSTLQRDGVLARICDLISETGAMRQDDSEKQRRERATTAAVARRNSNNGSNVTANQQRGIGYGTGSTRSRWDIERTVEQRLAREEHLIWLLNALTAYIYCANPDFSDAQTLVDQLARPRTGAPTHLNAAAQAELIGDSSIIALLEYHLNNDSVFDVSEHMELYQALLDVAASMALVPDLVPALVRPHTPGAKSIVKELLPRFRDTMSAYPTALRGQIGSPDFQLIDFIGRIETYADVLLTAAHRYERDLPVEQRVKTATTRRRKSAHDDRALMQLSSSPPTTSRLGTASSTTVQSASTSSADLNRLYTASLKHLQIQTCRFIGDYGKLVVPYTFTKEVRNLNPFSPALKDRTKRIAKELASMPNTLPLNASNSIFVCVDEGRCDIMKVLVTGPDETPYANGLFEFDVFFPTSYPFNPPRVAFLTTGAGNVRFNPNLYNDGKICLSILGTWEGRPEEKWTPYCSLLQVLISIQGLIFVKEPYFNEPGFERFQGTEKGDDFSRKYNLQIAHATLTYAIREHLRAPSEHFGKIIQRHFWLKRAQIIEQAQRWIVDMRTALSETEKISRKNDSATFDAVYSPQAQERAALLLIDELTHMPCPVDHCKFAWGVTRLLANEIAQTSMQYHLFLDV